MSSFPTATIFGLMPFLPKKLLILPCQGGEITLYVMDAKGYPSVTRNSRGKMYHTLKTVHFSGWNLPFENNELAVLETILRTDESAPELRYCLVEAVFRLVPHERSGQTAEVVALSFDNCKTFYWNTLSKLPLAYNG